MSSKNNYRQIFKATSLFGGVQVINILTLIIRAKFVAIFLGPIGVGVSNLLVSSTNLVSSVSSLGLNQSAIREISIANAKNDPKELSYVLIIFKRWLYFSAIFGGIILCFFSPYISYFTFGNYDFKWSFVFLSVMIFFNTLNNGNIALLEGTRNLKNTAKSSVLGAILGLTTTIPLYYFFGTKGIVPSIICGALIAFFSSYFFAKKIRIEKIAVPISDTFQKGASMAKMGILMVVTQILGSFSLFIINTFIRKNGGLIDVGYYQSASLITNQSITLVYAAMTVDFYPKLASISNKNRKIKVLINEQAIINTLISSPILIALIVYSPLLIRLVLTEKFLSIVNVVRLLSFGSLFTAPMVVLGFISLAKNDKKIYFIYGALINIFLALILYIIGYKFYGLIGISIGFVLSQIIYLIIISKKFYTKYSISFGIRFYKIFLIFVFLTLSAVLASMFCNEIIGYIIGSLLLLISVFFSYNKLDEYMEIKEVLLNKIKR